jgi:uncharacterized protein with HEPN domain
MPWDYKVYLDDILQAIARIREYTAGLSRTAFSGDARTFDAVVRNLEVIGEAAKRARLSSNELRGNNLPYSILEEDARHVVLAAMGLVAKGAL